MDHIQGLRLIASCTELLGACFLGVEAVKVANLVDFRKVVLRRLHDILNPRIIFVDEHGRECDAQSRDPSKSPDVRDIEATATTVGANPGRPPESVTVGRRPPDEWLFTKTTCLLWLVGVPFVTLCLAIWPSAWGSVSHVVSAHGWAGWLALGASVMVVPFLTGGIVWGALVWTLVKAISGMRAIERHTPTGAIGLIGIMLFFVTFIIRTAIDFRLIG